MSFDFVSGDSTHRQRWGVAGRSERAPGVVYAGHGC